MNKVRSLLVSLASIMIILFAAQNYAASEPCEPHSWVYRFSENYEVKSATEHSCDKNYYCSKCNKYITDKAVREAHSFDKFGYCSLCDYYRADTITLKSNSTVNVNSNTWMKVTAPKKGLVYLYVEEKYCEIELYNAKKRQFQDIYYVGEKDKIVIPVLKGTYYLKADGCTTIKYVFKSDPSRKNYTKKKAVSLKKNKTCTTVIYAGEKRSTWKRYYKIKLTKKQRIYVKASTLDYFDVAICNKKGKDISTSPYFNKGGDWKGYITDRRVAKGTYYLCISTSWNSAERKQITGYSYTFKWK